MRVNLGCGQFPLDGYLNVDADPSCPADQHFTFPPLPWGDGEVDEIYMGHLYEHFRPADGMTLLAECHRVLKPGGTIGIVVPDTREVCKRYLAGREDLNDCCREFFYSPAQKFPHLWAYDFDTLARAVAAAGFVDLTPINRWTDPRIPCHTWYGCGVNAVKGGA